MLNDVFNILEQLADMQEAENNLLMIMSNSDVERIKTWAVDNSREGVPSYLNNMARAYQLSFDGFSVDEILKV